jgi:hypothetical protein
MPGLRTVALVYLAKIRDMELPFILLRIDHAAAVALTPQEAVYYGCGAANAGVDREGLGRAIQGAGSAFHTGVFILDLHQTLAQDKNIVGTHLQADTASRAFFRL